MQRYFVMKINGFVMPATYAVSWELSKPVLASRGGGHLVSSVLVTAIFCFCCVLFSGGGVYLVVSVV